MVLLQRVRGQIAFDGIDLPPLLAETRPGLGIAYVLQARNVSSSLMVVGTLLTMRRRAVAQQRRKEDLRPSSKPLPNADEPRCDPSQERASAPRDRSRADAQATDDASR